MKLNQEVLVYLEMLQKIELKWMHSYDIDDTAFGIETDLYQLIRRVLNQQLSIEYMVEYLEKTYAGDYKLVCDNIVKLASNK